MTERKDKKTINHSTAESKSESGKYFQGVGRRKTAVARVRIYKSKNNELVDIEVNEKPIEKYFALPNYQRTVKSPIERLGLKSMKITARIVGGGISAQAEALRHGISRAILEMDETLRKKLKQQGFLTRVPRMVERIKYGLKKARKAPQWSKR